MVAVRSCNMSFDRVRPQNYVPIRLNATQVAPFFSMLKNRELVRGEPLGALKVTDKPFNDTTTGQVSVSTAASKAAKRVPGKASGSKPKKKRVKLEGKLSTATF